MKAAIRARLKAKKGYCSKHPGARLPAHRRAKGCKTGCCVCLRDYPGTDKGTTRSNMETRGSEVRSTSRAPRNTELFHQLRYAAL